MWKACDTSSLDDAYTQGPVRALVVALVNLLTSSACALLFMPRVPAATR